MNAGSGLLARVRHGRLGSGWMVVAALCFALLSVFVKLGSARYAPVELLFYRTLIGAVCLGGAMLLRNQSPWTHHWRGHWRVLPCFRCASLGRWASLPNGS